MKSFNKTAWYIKLPGLKYIHINDSNDLKINLFNYGTTSIKLYIDNDTNLTKECSITIKPPIQEINTQNKIYADFKVTYYSFGKNIDITNKTIPDIINQMPYEINCTSLSCGDRSYEWFVKSAIADSEYRLVDTTPNPVIKITDYGPINIKLRLNKDDSCTKEYWISTNEFGVTTEYKSEVIKEI